MTDPEPLKISTPQEMVVGTQFFTCHGTKTNIVILAADDKASLLLITSSVSSVLRLLSGTRKYTFQGILVSSR